MENNDIWFILTNLTNYKKIKLIEKYNNEEYIRKNSKKIKELYKVDLEEITDEEIKSFTKFIKNNNIGYITINSKEYPESLKHVEEPPYVIFYKGNLELL